MRSTFAEATVRLYHLPDGPGLDLAGPTALLYGPLEEAIRMAAAQPAEIQAGLFLATDNDVIAWADFAESL